MKKFIIVVLLTMGYCQSPAQAGVSVIAVSTIGRGSLPHNLIGMAETTVCLFPGGTCSAGCPVYIFTGAGEWDNPANWKDFVIPPAVLSACFEIIINPTGSKECLLNIPLQIIQAGATITVAPGKKFRVPGKLNIKE